MQSRLVIRTISLRDANAFIDAVHRHHKPVVGHKFSLSVIDAEGKVRGVATVGRPVARHRDDGITLEVTRVATDGCPNACSALYGAAWRAAKALGYARLGTYTLESEPGTSLRAAGWRPVHVVRGRSWSAPSRRRNDRLPLEDKILWEPHQPA
ncbi:XF1762 family protein [Microbacterium sp. ZXX196]|uniref:XF1762 family protein n=1 Tax=Microbacterium sp. ZXX196 TaxID=2609291 RepID=UPI0034D2996D